MYEDYLSKSLACIIMAKQALHNYKTVKIKDMKNIAAYNMQQSIEYIIRQKIYNCGKYTKNSQIYDHNIDRMIKKYCVPYGIDVPVKIRKNANIYTLWEAESRYDSDFSVRIDTLYATIRVIEEWLMEIRPYYNKKLNQVNKKLGNIHVT